MICNQSVNRKNRVAQAGTWRARTRHGLQIFLAAWVTWLIGTAPASAVSVDQSPLIIQASLPPNIVLMLDDSGSMAWDYMPNSVAGSSDDTLRSHVHNKVYYDPSVTYTPPIAADGQHYPDVTTFPRAPLNGFDSASPITSIPSWRSPFEDSGFDDGFPYGIDPQGSCFNGTQRSGWEPRLCYDGDPVSGLEDHFVFYRSDDVYYYEDDGPSAFVFVDSAGDVVGVSTDCSDPAISSETDYCFAPSDTSTNGVAAPDGVAAGTNVANWFSYYRTRVLSAKSGVMNAFATLDPDFRVGFGSINGGTYWSNDNDNFLTSPIYDGGRYTTYISEVQPFGDPGASGSRTSLFYWLENVRANSSFYGGSSFGGTPLRPSLVSVGEYLSTKDAWESDGGEYYACRQAYSILISDGYWNGGGFDLDPNDIDDDLDGRDGPTITNPNGVDFQYEPALPFADNDDTGYISGYENTLGDVAMYYWNRDLRTDIDNYVPTTDEDPGFWQHMTTFTVGLGVSPTGGMFDSGTTVDELFEWANGGPAVSGFTWPEPSSNSTNNIADMAHAAINGRGGFYAAQNPNEFAAAIADALGRAAERVGTGASLSANSTRLETGTVTYQANYFTGSWKGDLKAYAVDPGTKQIATNADWSAADNLLAAPVGTCTATGDQVCPGGRTIYTFDTDSIGVNNDDGYREFVTGELSNLSAAQQSALGSSTTEQQGVLNYLRGDSTNARDNGGPYRARSTPLGDIVNSQPVYAGKPDPNLFTALSFSGVGDYPSFAAAQSSRTPVVYVASNDGMLHGFNADTGAETYAYLPGAVLESGLVDIADPDYGANPNHQFFNDGELTIADVYYDSDWHTVLVGTTGRGEARAVYALDVTDPSDVKFLWERSPGDGKSGSDYIGQMTGKPLVVQTGNGQWSVVMGNGYNSDQNKAALLQFDAKGGGLTVHQTDANTGNGLAAPASFDYQTGPDGIQDVVYAGDLNGLVWRFDLENNTVSSVFEAKDDNGNAQPITAGMLLGKDPATGELWAFFGTGQYFAQSDLTDKSVQSWYGLVVESSTAGRAVSGTDSRSVLIEREILAETTASGTTLAARAFSKGTPGDIDSKSGWYMDLVSPNSSAEGERMVEPNQFQGSVLVGTSLVPEAVDVCNPSGRGYIMGLDPFDGTNVDQPFIDYNFSGTVDGSDTITVNGEQYAVGAVGFSRLPNAPIFVGNTMLVSFDDGSTASIQAAGGSAAGQRTSWREIVGD